MNEYTLYSTIISKGFVVSHSACRKSYLLGQIEFVLLYIDVLYAIMGRIPTCLCITSLPPNLMCLYMILLGFMWVTKIKLYIYIYIYIYILFAQEIKSRKPRQ